MTYENDPNRNRLRNDNSYLGWIIGGALALAVILGVFFMVGRDNTNTASNDGKNASAPATTGSGAITAPNNPAGTAAQPGANQPMPTPSPAPAR